MKWIAVYFSAIFFPAMALAGGAVGRTLVFPEETANTYVEMVPQKSMTMRAFTLCMRVATELKGEREVILFAYRTRYFDELNVWRELDGRLSFALSGEAAIFRVPEDLGALETHLCVVWDSSSGQSQLYVNGKKSLMKIYKKNHTVQSGGKVILGQDPDSYMGEFDANQSFTGEISDVNMWDYVLSPRLIQDLSEGKAVPRGNVFDWETVELKLNGNVHLVTYEL